MSVTAFKDFHKETKDLLGKMHMEAGKWKIESKVKVTKDTIVVNPTATNDGITCDVEYKSSEQPVGVKATIAPAGVKKVSVTYSFGPHQVEVATDAKFSAPEITVEGNLFGAAYSDKITKKQVEVSTSYSVFPGVTLAANTVYLLNAEKDKSALSYALAGRYALNGSVFDFATKNFKAFTFGAYSPIAYGDFKGTGAAEVDYTKDGAKVSTGFEMGCPLFPANTLRTRVSSDKKVTATYIVKLPTWKAAISATESGKFGAYFLLETK